MNGVDELIPYAKYFNNVDCKITDVRDLRTLRLSEVLLICTGR